MGGIILNAKHYYADEKRWDKAKQWRENPLTQSGPKGTFNHI